MKQFKDWENTSIRGKYAATIKDMCKKYADIFDLVVLFGSVVRGEDTDKSDLDFIVTPLY